MNEIEKLFADCEQAREKTQTFEYNREMFVAQKNEERKFVFQTADEFALAIAADPSELKRYLDVQTRFFGYSVINALLIAAQMPDARELRTFGEWKNRNKAVNKGERQICIVARRKDSAPTDTEMISGWDVYRMFDISQTLTESAQDGQPDMSENTNNADAQKAFFEALSRVSRAKPALTGSLPDGAAALFVPEQEAILTTRKQDDLKMLLPWVLKEVVHAEIAYDNENYSRDDFDGAALCASYILASKFGLPTSMYDLAAASRSLGRCFDSWAVRRELEVARRSAYIINRRLSKVLDAASQQGSP